MSQTLAASPRHRRPGDERVGRQVRRCPGCWPAPRSARWSARSSSTSSSSSSPRRSATPTSLATVLYVSSTYRHPGGRRGAADDRRRVRPVGRCRRDHLGAGRLDVQLPVHRQHVGRRRWSRWWSRSRSASSTASWWSRPGIPSFLVTLGTFFMLRGLNLAMTKLITGNVAHQRRVEHRRLRLGPEGVRLLVHRSAASTIRITLLWWLLFVVIGDLGAAAHPDRQLDLRGRRVGAQLAGGRRAGQPGEDRPVHGGRLPGLVHRHAHPVRVQHRAVRRRRRQRVHLHRRGGGRRLPAHRRLRLGRSARPSGRSSSAWPARASSTPAGTPTGSTSSSARCCSARSCSTSGSADERRQCDDHHEQHPPGRQRRWSGSPTPASYGNIIALHGVTLEVRAGEVTCVLGDNGAGKSTLIKIIAGLHQHTDGHVRGRGRGGALQLARARPSTAASPPSTRTWRSCR